MNDAVKINILGLVLSTFVWTLNASGQIIDNDNGFVTILGSGEVILTPGNSPGDVMITTLDQSDNIEDVQGIHIEMGNGDDTITIAGHLHIQGYLVVATGDGQDEVNISETEASSLIVDGSLSIWMDGGFDEVNFRDTMIVVGSDFGAGMGDGGCLFDLSNALVGGSLKIGGGSGRDDIYLGLEYISSTTGFVFVQRDIIINTYQHDDDVGIYGTVYCDSLLADTGPRRDSFTVKGLTANDARIETGNGVDRVNIFDSEFDQIEIESGFGSDTVSLHSVAVQDSTFVDLDRGNDQLFLHDSEFVGTSMFVGGNHFDLAEQTKCTFAWGQQFGFEQQNFDF